MSMMRGTSTAATRRPSATTTFRKPRIRCPPPETASAAARRIPALRPYTPPVTHGGWTGSSLRARTSPAPPRITYTGDSSSTYGVTASTISAPPSRCRSVAPKTARQSAGRITVSTMLQNTGPVGTARSPSTRVCSDDGVRHSTTVRRGPNLLPSSKRVTAGKSARTAQVRLWHPNAANVSSRVTIWGRPATSTRGFGTPMPPAASRDPSPPARIKPCTLLEHRFDVGKATDPHRGDELRSWGRRPLGWGEPARADTQPGGSADVRLEVVAHHPRALRRYLEGGQRVREDARVGLAPPDQRGVTEHGKESRQAELLQTRSQVAREIGHDAEAVAPGEPLENRKVTCHDLQRVGVQPARERSGVHLVGQELDDQPSLRFDRGAEPERLYARQARERVVRDLEEGVEGDEVEPAADCAISGVKAGTPVHPVGVEGAAEVEEHDVGRRLNGGRARGARARPSSWARTWACPPSPSCGDRPPPRAACSADNPSDRASPPAPRRPTSRRGQARTGRRPRPCPHPGSVHRLGCRRIRRCGSDARGRCARPGASSRRAWRSGSTRCARPNPPRARHGRSPRRSSRPRIRSRARSRACAHPDRRSCRARLGCPRRRARSDPGEG